MDSAVVPAALNLYLGPFRSNRRFTQRLTLTAAPTNSCASLISCFPVIAHLRSCRRLFLISCAVGDSGGGASDESSTETSDTVDLSTKVGSGSGSREGYIGLFVQMLGLDNDPLDREQAVTTLWKYSEGGKSCIDAIMQFSGCTKLVVSLLKSDSDSTCEAAAGLLKSISSISLYRDAVAESGAIEEITAVLCRPFLTSGVKEQNLCTLWNLSIDEKHGTKIAKSDLVYFLVKFLGDEEVKVKEAVGGILANLALNPCNHGIMVEAGLIPKLAEVWRTDAASSKVLRKEAKAALLELAKDGYFRILITEEGFVRVPLIGAAAYRSYKPLPHSWPSLPDGTQIERTSRPSRYGASELLLGLNVRDRKIDLEEAKMYAMVGRSQQQFLARIGAIETDEGSKSYHESAVEKHTLLPWIDGVARLVLIIGLEDESAISRAAYCIADASVNEYMRIAFMEAGAVRPLVLLLGHRNETVKEAAIHALERLSVSNEVCQMLEAEGIMDPLINIIKNSDTAESLLEKCVVVLSRILDPGKKLKGKVVNGSEELLTAGTNFSRNASARPFDSTSINEVTSRERIIGSDIASRLITLLISSAPTLQVTIASIIEHLATCEEYVLAIRRAGIESGLDNVFQQGASDDLQEEAESQPELTIPQAEEMGLAIAEASRLLAKLLDFEQFCNSIDSKKFTTQLRKILRSNTFPLHTKEWVAACLVKLESQLTTNVELGGYPIDLEVTLYEAIPRLVEQMSTSFDYSSREAAAVELNEIISRGAMECTKALASAGGIFPLVKLIEEGDGDGLEASLSILYNLSMDSENHSAIISAGAVPILKRIVLSERPQWTRALRLLRTLPT